MQTVISIALRAIVLAFGLAFALLFAFAFVLLGLLWSLRAFWPGRAALRHAHEDAGRGLRGHAPRRERKPHPASGCRRPGGPARGRQRRGGARAAQRQRAGRLRWLA
jgi:hypothetical protein